ncbi:hypothetical protein HDU82_002990, partial [Entophlyctis luteolus]
KLDKKVLKKKAQVEKELVAREKRDQELRKVQMEMEVQKNLMASRNWHLIP